MHKYMSKSVWSSIPVVIINKWSLKEQLSSLTLKDKVDKGQTLSDKMALPTTPSPQGISCSDQPTISLNKIGRHFRTTANTQCSITV